MDDHSSSPSASSSGGGNGSSNMGPMPFASMLGKKSSAASFPDEEEAAVAMGVGGHRISGTDSLVDHPQEAPSHLFGSDELQHNQEHQSHHQCCLH